MLLEAYNCLSFSRKLNLFEEVMELSEKEQGVSVPHNPLVCITPIDIPVDRTMGLVNCKPCIDTVDYYN